MTVEQPKISILPSLAFSHCTIVIRQPQLSHYTQITLLQADGGEVLMVPGPRGRQGLAGEKGQKGDVGKQGLTGARGRRGEQGRN